MTREQAEWVRRHAEEARESIRRARQQHLWAMGKGERAPLYEGLK